MEMNSKTYRRALWIVLPVLAIGAFALPRALAFHRHSHSATAAELTEHIEDGLDHLLDHVDDVTDAQRAAANVIAERRGPELFKVVEQGRAVRGKLKLALLAAQPDKQQLTVAQADVDALAKQASQIGLDTMFELSNVLTPTQRKQIADRLARFER